MPTYQSLSLDQGAASFQGAISLQVTEQGVVPWRLNYQDLELYEPGFIGKANTPAGVRLSFISNTTQLRLTTKIKEPDLPASLLIKPDQWVFDLLIDGQLHQRHACSSQGGVVEFTDLPNTEKWIELYFSVTAHLIVTELAIDQGATVEPFNDTRPRWITYGSSITHCGASEGPSETWPAIVANRCGLNLTCLGYGGNCHAEPIVASMIRDSPADYISLCIGINIQGGSSYSKRTYRASVIGLIQTIREKHPATPMVLISPICSPPRETTPNNVEVDLVWMREQNLQVVEIFQQRGDQNLHYVSGLDLFGPEFVKYMPDELHPNAEGYRLLAEQYIKQVTPYFELAAV